MRKNDQLAVHANRFRKQKFLLLFTVLEKNESCIFKDENENEDAPVIGEKDDEVRKRAMTICHKTIRTNQIGPKA